ncbi:MAG: hypothetical protein ABEJ96_03040, partial [Thiohalorhabdaceae bacterium]
FTEKAPADVVAKEREKLAEYEDRYNQLKGQRDRLSGLQS